MKGQLFGSPVSCVPGRVILKSLFPVPLSERVVAKGLMEGPELVVNGGGKVSASQGAFEPGLCLRKRPSLEVDPTEGSQCLDTGRVVVDGTTGELKSPIELFFSLCEALGIVSKPSGGIGGQFQGPFKSVVRTFVVFEVIVGPSESRVHVGRSRSGAFASSSRSRASRE